MVELCSVINAKIQVKGMSSNVSGRNTTTGQLDLYLRECWKLDLELEQELDQEFEVQSCRERLEQELEQEFEEELELDLLDSWRIELLDRDYPRI